MDPNQAQAVWQRVSAPGSADTQTQIAAQRLERLIVVEQLSRAELRALADRPGREKQSLLRLSRAAAQREQSLVTLYYLLTGRRLRLKPPKPETKGPYLERLRAAYLRRSRAEEDYASLSSDLARESDQLAALARTSGREKEQLRNMIRAQLANEPRPAR